MNDKSAERKPLFDRDAIANAEIPEDWNRSNIYSIIGETIENLNVIADKLAPLADEQTRWEIEQHTQRNRDLFAYWDRAIEHFKTVDADDATESQP